MEGGNEMEKGRRMYLYIVCVIVCLLQYMFATVYVCYSICLLQYIFATVYVCYSICLLQYMFATVYVCYSICLLQYMFATVYVCYSICMESFSRLPRLLLSEAQLRVSFPTSSSLSKAAAAATRCWRCRSCFCCRHCCCWSGGCSNRSNYLLSLCVYARSSCCHRAEQFSPSSRPTVRPPVQPPSLPSTLNPASSLPLPRRFKAQ